MTKNCPCGTFTFTTHPDAPILENAQAACPHCGAVVTLAPDPPKPAAKAAKKDGDA